MGTKQQQQHTPGPWILNVDTVHIPRHTNGVAVKVQPVVYHGDTQGMADARLICWKHCASLNRSSPSLRMTTTTRTDK